MTTQISNSFSLTIAAPSSAPSWAQNAIGAWTAIPNSILRDDAQGVKQTPDPLGTQNPPEGAMYWSGVVAAYDEPSIYYWGGGHGNYAGNEVYRLTLEESPTWSREIDASPSASVVVDTGYYTDGKPNPWHTYFNCLYDINRRRLMFLSSEGWYGDGSHGDIYEAIAFDIDAGLWLTGNNNGQSGTIRGGVQYIPTTGGTSGLPYASACSNPVTGDQYTIRMGSSGALIFKWSTSTQTWSSFGSLGTTNWNVRGVLAVDTTRGDVWGFLNGQAPLRVSSAGVLTRPTLTGASASIFNASQLAAAHYVPALDSIVATLNAINADHSQIWVMNCATLACTQVSTTGTVTQTAFNNGNDGNLYKRFHYVPSLKGVFTIPYFDTPAFFCRLHD